MLFNIILLLLFVAVFSSLLRDGLWSNTLTLFSVIIAGLVATNYFEPLADMLTGLWAGAIHFYDILALAAVFAAVYMTLRVLLTRISRYRMRFHPLMDNIGGVVVAGWIGWLAVCFTCFAIHLAPLTRNPFNGGFDPEAKMFFGTAPDRTWLAFAAKLSNGGSLGRNATDESGALTSAFDPQGEFLFKYASRRAWLDTKPSAFVDE